MATVNAAAASKASLSDGSVNNQVRRIAILVTSLDAAAGRQLLLAMPTELARQVRRAMTQLGPIDPDEQREILAEFRLQALTSTENSPTTPAQHDAASGRSSRDNQTQRADHVAAGRDPASPAGGAASSSAQPPTDERERAAQHTAQPTVLRPWQRLQAGDLTELLRGERAPVIAVVLSQLDAARAAGLLEQLSTTQQREVIAAFSQLGQIDPEAMAAIDEHLASRISDYQHRRASEGETLGRMQELLAAASPQSRGQWQAMIHETDHQLAKRMGIVSTAAINAAPKQEPQSPANNQSRSQPTTQAATQPIGPLSPGQSSQSADAPGAIVDDSQKSREATLLEILSSNVVTTADRPYAAEQRGQSSLPSPPHQETSHRATSHQAARLSPRAEVDEPTILPFRPPAVPFMRFEQFLDLAPEQIGEVLASVPTEVLLLALTGASPAFMKRFTSMLEKRDARALQARLRQITSINLKDVEEAQRRLCERATQMMQAATAVKERADSTPAAQRVSAAA